MKPPMSYAGGKQLIADRVIELLQPHDHYIEPFFGSGAVLFAKSPSRLETVNDLDDRLVNFWRVLRDRPEELAWACAMTPHSRQEFLLAHQPSPVARGRSSPKGGVVVRPVPGGVT